MPLTPGTRIGPYEVVGSLGAGGMGEVYCARDVRLGRDVALKILPPAFAADPERLARFDREAQVLASLNHPHIAQIYGVEESGGTRALVMELVNGPTLVGPLDPPEAIRIARQIALALEAAHERGITHRDLKPSNVKVAADGSVKVLDFGLAKLSPSSESSRTAVDVTASPTLMSPTLATTMGVILGTAAYMSPEQARGKAVDKRSDIWAFGCVLYEMLTGRRAFNGEEVSDTLASVLRDDPDWSRIPASVSPTVRHYLTRCLAKDPQQRVHDIADMRLALEGAFDVPVETGRATTDRAPRSWRRTLAMTGGIAVAVLVAAGLGALGGRRVWPDPIPRVTRLAIVPSNGTPITPTQLDSDVAVSPDGSRVAFLTLEQGRLAMYVRALDRIDTVRIEGVNVPRLPFFSPDGESVGFFDGAALKRVSASGGPVVTIASIVGAGLGASWSEDGSIVYKDDGGRGLKRVSVTGGEAVQITTETNGESHVFPEVLPGARAVLFTRLPPGLRGSGGQISVVDLMSGAVNTIAAGGGQARYASSGHVVYGFSGTLRAIRFDVRTLTASGNPVPVVDRVITKASGTATFALSTNGSLVYEAGDIVATGERTLVWVDRNGVEEVLAPEKRAYVYPRISPDGKRLALDIRDQESDIWVWDFARRSLQRLTFDPGLNRGGIWTRDSRRLIFSGELDGAESLFSQEADGSGAPERLTTALRGRPHVPYSMAPDGTHVLFGEPGQPPYDVFTLQLGGDHARAAVLNAPYNEHNAEVSPNGRWLAYQSDESGTNEIYVRRYPTLDSRAQISSGGGTRPMWARDGRELFYLKPDNTLVVVPVERSDTGGFVAGASKALFQGPYYALQAGRSYDISPDGKRFVMIKESTSAPVQLLVVQNWFAELNRLVPLQ